MANGEEFSCDLCGTADFSHARVRSVRCVYRCSDCRTITCSACTGSRPDPRGGFRGTCGRCRSENVVDIAAFPPKLGADEA